MAAGRARRRFTIATKVAQEPMATQDVAAVERILARLIAKAYVADHPELFPPAIAPSESKQVSGPPAAGAPVAGALPANAGGPEEESREHDRSIQREDR